MRSERLAEFLRNQIKPLEIRVPLVPIIFTEPLARVLLIRPKPSKTTLEQINLIRSSIENPEYDTKHLQRSLPTNDLTTEIAVRLAEKIKTTALTINDAEDDTRRAKQARKYGTVLYDAILTYKWLKVHPNRPPVYPEGMDYSPQLVLSATAASFFHFYNDKTTRHVASMLIHAYSKEERKRR